MFGIPSIYAMIAGGVAVLGILGGFYGQGRQIHQWHTAYLTDEKTIAVLKDRMVQREVADQEQINKTKSVVNTVVTEGPPRIISVVEHVAVPTDCSTPKYPDEVKNAF